MRKSIVVILNLFNIKNNKIYKDNFKKIHNKKNHVGNTVAIHSVLKKTTKLNYLTAQYEKNLTKTILEKKQKKIIKKEKKPCGETL
jgi:hypothetical protein